jgi:polyisoprenoid-binding protein YceI
MAMKRITLIVVVIVALVVLAGGGFFAYIWFAGGPGEPSAEAEAEALEPQQPESIVYEVVGDLSEARFLIEEVLRGEQNTVVGTTDQIDGSIAIEYASNDVEIGEFVINVRTIETDDEVRDRSIRTLILESNKDEFEFSTFRPTAVDGLPESVDVGSTFSFQVTGDLTVRDVTSPVTFDMRVEIRSEREIAGIASTTILWEDFDITIPYVGGDSIVASVEDQVDLEMEFVARARND